MKRRALSFIGILCILMMLFTTMPIAVSAASEKDIIVNNEYECTWGYYYFNEKNGDPRWYISQLGYSGKVDVYSLGYMDPNVGWMTVGTSAATVNSGKTSITIDNGLSRDASVNVRDEGNDKTTYFPKIIDDRKLAEGETVNISWYYFQADNDCWYIVNDSTVAKLTSDFDWPDIDIGNYVPSFSIRNGKKYVKFVKEGSDNPPVLTGYSSMPSQISHGRGYDIEGKIISDSPITKVTINVFKTDGSWRDSQSVTPYSYTYDLAGINEDLHFASYPAGNMEIQIWAVNSAGAYPLIGRYEGQNQLCGETFTIVNTNANDNGIKLNVPLYKQNDGRWKNVKIGSKTIGAVGCTTTAIAMVYSYHTNQTIYPDDMRNKLSYSNNDLYWYSLPNVGLSSKEYNSGISQDMLATIYTKLKAGKPVIIGATTGSGDYQHWVVIVGYKGSESHSYSTSDFIVNDPGTQASETLTDFLENGSKADRTKIKRIIY